MSSENRIKVAILGAGEMGESVIQHLQHSPLVQSIGVFDPRLDRMAALKERFGVDSYPSLDETLRDPAIKLVFVTASNDMHKTLTISALEAGKAVMCEKPMATPMPI